MLFQRAFAFVSLLAGIALMVLATIRLYSKMGRNNETDFNFWLFTILCITVPLAIGYAVHFGTKRKYDPYVPFSLTFVFGTSLFALWDFDHTVYVHVSANQHYCVRAYSSVLEDRNVYADSNGIAYIPHDAFAGNLPMKIVRDGLDITHTIKEISREYWLYKKPRMNGLLRFGYVIFIIPGSKAKEEPVNPLADQYHLDISKLNHLSPELELY